MQFAVDARLANVQNLIRNVSSERPETYRGEFVKLCYELPSHSHKKNVCKKVIVQLSVRGEALRTFRSSTQ